MGQMKKMLMLMFLSIPLYGMAQRVVSDPKANAIVLANMAAQAAAEEEHNKHLDSLTTRQRKIMAYTTTMSVAKEMYKMSMQNIRGFGTESKYYAEMGRLAWDIIERVPRVMKAMNNKPGINHIICLEELENAVENVYGAMTAFVDIVNNGKIKTPLDSGYVANDKYNFFDRYKRWEMASKIRENLREAKYALTQVEVLCKYHSNLGQLIKAIDPKGWAKMVNMKVYTNMIINEWNSL